MANPAILTKFTVSHVNDSDFKGGGLRSHAEYRDLGLVDATNGKVRAHVIRRNFAVPLPEISAASKRHHHDLSFQLVYVLKGWIKVEIEGQGEMLMRTGSCWTQPGGIRHKVLDRGEDTELLEIVMPADFETVNVD